MKNTYTAQRQKLQRTIDRLNKQLQVLQQKERAPVLARIVRTMKDHGITVNEIAQAYRAVRRPGAAAPKAIGRIPGRAGAAKYRNPETGQTWSGRGRTPTWLVNAERAGKSREDFLITAPAAASSAEDAAAVPSPDQTAA